MNEVKLGDRKYKIDGPSFTVGDSASDSILTTLNLEDVRIGDFTGHKILLNIFPSVDTPVCAKSVRRFNEEVSKIQNTIVLCISMDLPFAQQDFCGKHNIDNVIMLSAFRSDFSNQYGLKFIEGPMRGLLARTIIAIDNLGKIIYSQIVDDISKEPNYELAINTITK